MNKLTLPYTKIEQLSHTDKAYLRHDPALRPFYAYEPTRDNLLQAIIERSKYPVNRSLLLEILKKQYQYLDIPFPYADEDILNEQTFTITTAHQPTLLTGPLFHIYKIASVIHAARDIGQLHSSGKIIPVFIMSGEDHDWEEVNHFYLFGKKHIWEREASGPCGRLSLEGLNKVIIDVHEVLKNTPFGKEINEMLTACIQKATNYGHFHRLLISHLFRDTGLIVLDLDEPEFKQAFIPLFEKEILTQFSHRHVTDTQHAIEEAGFRIQAHCRQINLFYMTEEHRERIDLVGDHFIRGGSGISYTVDELINELHARPENFSPNVILRPLYQDYQLPNIAYTGGGGEIAYWLERKKQFEEAGVHYPMLIRRNSMMMVEPAIKASAEKLDLQIVDFFHEINFITKDFLRKHSRAEIDFDNELKMISSAYESLAAKAEKMDPTLSKAILAEETKHKKSFEQLGSRLARTEKHFQDTQIKKLQRIREKLFPGGGLQERHENFLSFYAAYGPSWLHEIISIADPFEEEFILLELPAQSREQSHDH